MSLNHVGIPGIGGSLGECQICGENFLTEILTGTKVATFGISMAPNQTLYAHQKCLPLLKEGMPPEELPEKSPIRHAMLKLKAAQP